MNKVVQHEHDKGLQVKPRQRVRQVGTRARSATKTGHPGKGALDHQSARGSSTKPPLARGNLITFRRMPYPAASSGGYSPV
jgi:hypothetical protein